MASQLGLYNAALLFLGERKLASLGEDREPRRALDEVWNGGFLNRVLEAGQWKFASRTIKLVPCAGITPAFGYKYPFEKPADYVRIMAISLDEHMALPVNQYQDEGNFWYLDYDVIYVTYISNAISVGGDLARWPPAFTQYVEVLLASRVARRLTGNEQLWKDAVALAARYLTAAESIDAMAGPARFLPPGAWIQARGGNGRRDNGNRGRLIG